MKKPINYKLNEIINGVKFIKEVKLYISPSGYKERKAEFECKCGKHFVVHIKSVKSGHTTSCGCYQKKRVGERFTKHGLSKHPLYAVWCTMKQRCYNKNNKRYYCYGRRGISICDEWQDNPNQFIEWAETHGYKKGLQIDRIDNNGNYEPSNCRFVDLTTNMQNSTNTKLNWDIVTEIRNAKLLLPNISFTEIAKAYNMSRAQIARIIKNKAWILQT